jgi:hypothetical protein
MLTTVRGIPVKIIGSTRLKQAAITLAASGVAIFPPPRSASTVAWSEEKASRNEYGANSRV